MGPRVKGTKLEGYHFLSAIRFHQSSSMSNICSGWNGDASRVVETALLGCTEAMLRLLLEATAMVAACQLKLLKALAKVMYGIGLCSKFDVKGLRCDIESKLRRLHLKLNSIKSASKTPFHMLFDRAGDALELAAELLKAG